MVLYQRLQWDHLPWPWGLTCWHPSGSHAAITWGWPQHMFVYPGIKWVCGDFTGSALHCPALKFRYPQSSHKETADGVGSAPWYCPVAASYPGHELPQAPRTWTTSGESTLLLTLPLHFVRVFCIPNGERRWSWHSGLDTQFSGDLDFRGFLQCYVVMVEGEATMSRNTCAWIGVLMSSLFLIETTAKFISGMIIHKTYEPSEAAKIDPSFFLERGRGNNLTGPNYSVC